MLLWVYTQLSQKENVGGGGDLDDNFFHTPNNIIYFEPLSPVNSLPTSCSVTLSPSASDSSPVPALIVSPIHVKCLQQSLECLNYTLLGGLACSLDIEAHFTVILSS